MELINQGIIVDAEKMEGTHRSHMMTSLYHLSSGKLMTTFRRGSDKSSVDGNCVLAESDDMGSTWKEICDGFPSVFRGRQGEVRNAELLQRPDGSLVAFLTWKNRSENQQLYDEETGSTAEGAILKGVSQDRGRTWSGFDAIDLGDACHSVLSGSTTKLDDAGYLVTYEKQERTEPNSPTAHTARALFSRDGVEFDDDLLVAHDETGHLHYYDQRQDYCPDQKALVAAFWTYDKKIGQDVNIHLSWGKPEGMSWETPRDTGIRGQIADPILLPDGRLCLFYVHRHPPCSLRLVLSEDHGMTWDTGHELTVYSKETAREAGMTGPASYAEFWDSMAAWTFGHPSGMALDDRNVYLIYYAGRDARNLSVCWAKVAI